MRYIVLSLFLLNGVYLIYSLYREKGTRSQDVPGEVRGNIPSIQLLRENTDQYVRQSQMDRVVKNPLLRSEALKQDCKAIGPFISVTPAQVALERLEALDYEVRLRALDQLTGERDYRVMIPPAVSMEAAFRQLRELQSRGIDSYVIMQGKDTLGISLGVYSTVDAADTVQRDLIEKGYESRITQIARQEREYWIFSKEFPDLEIEDNILVMLRQEFPDIQHSLQTCL
jgi:hypothetical protein